MKIPIPAIAIIAVIVTAMIQLNGQIREVLFTDVDRNWTITKTNQAFTYEPASETDLWVSSKKVGVLNNDWTDEIKVANIEYSQIYAISKIGNGAKPVWIVRDPCSHIDNKLVPAVYHMRNVFSLRGGRSKLARAVIKYAVDNLCRIYINGRLVVPEGGLYDYEGIESKCQTICGISQTGYVKNPPAKSFSGRYFTKIETVDITELMEPGVNVLAVEVINVGGCGMNYAWFCASMEMDYQEMPIHLEVEDIIHKSCKGDGAVKISVKDGKKPYQFKLNGLPIGGNSIFTDLPVGKHLIGVEDATGSEGEILVHIEDRRVFPTFSIRRIDNYIDCESESTLIELESGEQKLTYSLDGEKFSTKNIFNDLSEGKHIIVARNESGCESRPLIFEVYKNKYFVLNYTTQNICSGSSIDFRGKTISTEGIYRDTIQALKGCDTIFQMKLTVLPIQQSTIKRKICKGELLRIGSVTYSDTGEFLQKLTASNGCDSLVRIIILDEDPQYCPRKKFTYQDQIKETLEKTSSNSAMVIDMDSEVIEEVAFKKEYSKVPENYGSQIILVEQNKKADNTKKTKKIKTE